MKPIGLCTVKILGGGGVGGRGGGTICTPSPYEQLFMTPTPTTPLQASFTVTALPIHHPCAPPIKIFIVHIAFEVDLVTNRSFSSLAWEQS